MNFTSIVDYFTAAQSKYHINDQLFSELSNILSQSLASTRKKASRLKSFLAHNYGYKLPKQTDLKNFMKALVIEKKSLKLRKEAQEKKSFEKFQAEQKKIIESIEREKELKDQSYKLHLQSLIEHAELRKNTIRQARSELKGVKKIKRLYESLEENFTSSSRAKELEERNSFLSENRKKHSPVRIAEILKHSKKHSLLIEERKSHKIQKIFDLAPAMSPLMKVIMAREQHTKLQEEMKKIRAKEFIEKRIGYAKHAQELHKPRIDSLKKQELQIIKERIKLPVRRKIYSGKDVMRSRSVLTSSKSTKSKLASSGTTERKIKANFIEEIRTKRKKTVVKVRSMSFERVIDRNSIIKQANQMEELSRRQEYVLKSTEVDNLSQLLEAEESANELLLRSIHSKISLLNEYNVKSN